MKKVLAIIIALTLLLSLAGCAKLVSEEYEAIQVKVVDEYYRSSYMTPMIVNKVTIMQNHPAKYIITVEYEGMEYELRDRGIYYKYKDKIGQIVDATLRIRTYDTGRISYDIILE